MRNDRGYIEPEVFLLFPFIIFIVSMIFAFSSDSHSKYKYTKCTQASNANFVVCKSDYDTLTLDKRKVVDISFDEKNDVVNVHYCKPAGDDVCADFALEAKSQAEADNLTDLLDAQDNPS